jgi:hypothetical protein
MALPDWKLSIITFAERWDGLNDELHLRVLVLPRRNPLEPLAASEPAFASASLAFQAMLIPSLDRLPDPADVTATRALNVPTPPSLGQLYGELSKAFPLAPAGSITSKPQPRGGDAQIKKFPPVSYRPHFRSNSRVLTPLSMTHIIAPCEPLPRHRRWTNRIRG